MDNRDNREALVKRSAYKKARTVNSDKIIEAVKVFGSIAGFADFLDVRPSTVVRWMDRVTEIDPIVCLAIEDKVGVRAIDILPNFPWEKIGYHKRYNHEEVE